MGSRIAVAVGLALVVVLAPACRTPPRWESRDDPTREDARTLLEAEDVNDLTRELLTTEVPLVPVRERLRPCCVFGSSVGIRLTVLPLPLVALPNVISPEDVGPHSYDSGLFALKAPEGYTPSELAPLRAENNGLVYTCRGGFVDTAHVRDYVDWTLYLTTEISRNLESGVRFELPSEGARRWVVLKPVDPVLLDAVGRLRLAVPMSQWLAFQMSVWHEIATWYGWASVPGFSEEASAFSPEDLYSNMIGVKMFAGIVHRRSARTEYLYNESVEVWLARVLELLGAQPEEIGDEAARVVDQHWWDSTARVPDRDLVVRRNFEVGDPLEPWIVPPRLQSEPLRKACGDAPHGMRMSNPESFQGAEFRDWLTLEIEVDEDIASQPPFDRLGRRVTQNDFPAIIDEIRRQSLAEFGPGSDRPD